MTNDTTRRVQVELDRKAEMRYKSRLRLRHTHAPRRRLFLSASLIVAAAWSGSALGADGVRGTAHLPHHAGALVREGVLLHPHNVKFVPGRLLVRFRDGTSESVRSNVLGDAGVMRSRRSYHLVPRLELVELAPGHSVAAAMKALQARKAVAYATPDYKLPLAKIPNDPEFGQQWGMTAIGAPAAWEHLTGDPSVTVGVLDTGIQMTHPDLVANIWTNPGENCGSTDPTITCAGRTDGIDNDGNGYVDDVHGWDWVNSDNDPSDDINHGTHVAGIIGAVGDNGIGVAGVNWTVRLMPLKVCAAFCSISGEILALQYAADKGVKIVNSSFGGPIPYVPSEHDAIQAAGAAGIIDVASASNNSTDNDVIPVYPASYDLDNVVAVAATNSTGDLAPFSNFGATSVDLGAPGDNIYSTYPTDSYAALSGTSMAAPQVSGAAALLEAKNPGWTRQQIETRLIDTTHSLSGLTGTVASCGELDIGAATDATVVNNARVCVKMSGTGSGSVASAPTGIDCGSTCVAPYSPGTSVTLTATPASGSTFTGWRGPCSGTGTCTLNPSSVIVVTALFRRGGSPGGWNQSPVTPPSARTPFLPNSGREGTFYNVSVSGNGNVRAKTVYNPPGPGVFCLYNSTDTGGIFLQRKTASGWVDDGVLHAPAVGADSAARWTNCGSFGRLTALSGDGSRLLVSQDMAFAGAPGTYRCVAFVYAHGSSGWSLDGTLFPPGIGPGGAPTTAGCDYFGTGGAISSDGNRVAIYGTSDHMYADVFVRDTGGWSEEQRLDAPICGTNTGPGLLAISTDGSRILLGDSNCVTPGGQSGVVQVFTRSGSTWALTQTITPPENISFLHFGRTVVMAGDGKTAAIGSNSGLVWVYERGSSWQMKRKLQVGSDSSLLCPVLVRAGARLICRTSETVGFNTRQGALYVFDRPTGGWAASTPVPVRAYATDGLASDFLGTPLGIAATDGGTVIDAVVSSTNLARGYYTDNRIGYEFVTPDPIGKLLEAPSPVRASSTGNALTFTYTAATALANGALTLTVPTGWSLPSTSSGDPGYTTSSNGTVTVSNRVITVGGLTVAKGQTFTITYGASAGATAPSAGGDQGWPVTVRVAPGDPFVALVAPPVVRILAADGTGTMNVSPSSIKHGVTGKTLTFTYTAATGGTVGGTVTLDVPTGWSAPSTTGSDPGFTKASTGSLSVSGRTVTVSGLDLISGQKLVITYGARTSGGPGASAPTTAVGAQTWQATEASSSPPTPVNLATSPVVTIT